MLSQKDNPFAEELKETAKYISRRGHGILASDESNATTGRVQQQRRRHEPQGGAGRARLAWPWEYPAALACSGAAQASQLCDCEGKLVFSLAVAPFHPRRAWTLDSLG